MTVEELNLEPDVEAKARELKQRASSVVFTSGRRTVEAQCSAMAQNTIQAGRGWIRATYASSEPREALIGWMHAHPEADTREELAKGFAGVLRQFTPAELSHLSKHLGGRAFDVQPRSCKIADLRALRPRKLIQSEGGLVRWHVDF